MDARPSKRARGRADWPAESVRILLEGTDSSQVHVGFHSLGAFQAVKLCVVWAFLDIDCEQAQSFLYHQ